MGCAVIKVSDTVQEFNGERFYRCGNYFQRNGKRLHRTVCEFFNGEIPAGYHVHHIDGDRTNNEPDNLMPMRDAQHIHIHATSDEHRANGRRAIEIAIAEAPKWHKSEEGAEWHSKHALEYWQNAPLNDYVCSSCGKHYQTRNVSHQGNHFCGLNCRAAYGRRKRAGKL